MPDVRRTAVEVATPSRLQQRLDAAQHQADAEVGVDEVAVNVRIAGKPTHMGKDHKLWWPITYEVESKPRHQ